MAQIDDLLERLNGKRAPAGAFGSDAMAEDLASRPSISEPILSAPAMRETASAPASEKPDYMSQAILAFAPALTGVVLGGESGAKAAAAGSDMVNKSFENMRQDKKDQKKLQTELEQKRLEREREALKEERRLQERRDDKEVDREFRREMANQASLDRQTAAQEKRADKAEKDADLLVVPGYESTPGVKVQPAVAEKMRDAVGTLNSMKKSTELFKDLTKEHGSFEWGGKGGADLQQIQQDLLMKSKELYNLGVLNGPDLMLLEKQIPDPSSWGSLMTRDSTRMAQIEAFEKSLDNIVESKLSARGYSKKESAPSFPMQVRKGNQVATVKTASELKEAQEEGWE